MDNLKGNFLVSAKNLIDPSFYRTVVLIIEQGSQGAMGLVVNRPSDISVSHALTGQLELPSIDDPVYLGGPVEPGGLIVLHDRGDITDSEPIIPGVFVPTNADVFEEVIQSAIENPAETTFRVFSGCAGWAPDQLEQEIERGDWYLVPAEQQAVFHDSPYDLWERMLKKISERLPFFDSDVPRPERN